VFLAEEENFESMAGYCTLKLKTGVTVNQSEGFPVPSAAMTTFVVVGVFAAILSTYIYCRYCRRSPTSTNSPKKERRRKAGGKRSSKKDDETALNYKSMGDGPATTKPSIEIT